MIIAELFSLEQPMFFDAFFTIPGMILQFCSLLDHPAPLSSLRASYFAKIMILLLSKRPIEVHPLTYYEFIDD